jgi:hypothetical protein
MRTKRFVVTGDIEVQGQQVKDANGKVCGYRQKDGSIIKLVVGLEVENKDGTKYEYLVTDKQMRAHGFAIGLYDQTDFE